MVTAALIVVSREDMVTEKLVEGWEFYSTPDEPHRIELPALSSLERLTMESNSNARKKLGFDLAKVIESTRDYMRRHGTALHELAMYVGQEQAVASLQVSVPVGHYESDKLLNIGTNRWSVKPELGVSKAWGPLILELMTSVTLYTDSVYVGKGLSQWMASWKANGWRRREGKDSKAVKNEDLWRKLDELAGRDVERFSRAVRGQYADLIGNGLWFTPLREALDAAFAAELPELADDPHLAIYWLLHTTMLAEVRPAVPDLEHVFVARGQPRDGQHAFAVLTAQAWEAREGRRPLAGSDPNRVNEVVFTSGTTGEPKGVMHTSNTTLSIIYPLIERLAAYEPEPVIGPEVAGFLDAVLVEHDDRLAALLEERLLDETEVDEHRHATAASVAHLEDAIRTLEPGDFAATLEQLYRRLGQPKRARWFGGKETLCEEFVPYLLERGAFCAIILRDPRDTLASMNHGRAEAMRR